MEQLADLPIIVLRLNPDFDAESEIMRAMDAGDEILLRIHSPVYYICDATLAPTPTVKGLIEGANWVVCRPNFKHVQSRIRETMLIAPNKAMQVAARGLNTEAFGWLNIRVFATYDGALDYLRDKLGEVLVE